VIETVRRCAQEAINKRLGGNSQRTIIDVRAGDTPGSVFLHVNSGGNSLVAEQALQWAGYRVVVGPQPAYGVVLIVTGSNPHSPAALSPEEMAEQVKISNEIIAEVIADEERGRGTGSYASEADS
jgi:hypothetical protein